MTISRNTLYVGSCMALSIAITSHAHGATSPGVAWTKQIGTVDDDASRSVALDALGNVYISGFTYGDLDGVQSGYGDAFLTKYDSAGNELWSSQIGSTAEDWSYSVAVDGAGHAYISGFTEGDFAGAHAGNQDAFLTKFDPTGNELWSKQLGTATSDYSRAVAVDASGNAYISGRTVGDLGGTNAGGSDAFLTKFDASGNELWSTQIGTTGNDISYSVAVDAAGNAWISGRTYNNLGGIYAGASDAFLAKFDASGNELWTTQIGTTEIDYSYSVAVDAVGHAYISGWTEGDLGGTNSGSADAFLVKFEVPEPASIGLLALGVPALLRRR